MSSAVRSVFFWIQNPTAGLLDDRKCPSLLDAFWFLAKKKQLPNYTDFFISSWSRHYLGFYFHYSMFLWIQNPSGGLTWWQKMSFSSWCCLIRGIHLSYYKSWVRKVDASPPNFSLLILDRVSCISLKRELPLTLEYNLAIILFGWQ